MQAAPVRDTKRLILDAAQEMLQSRSFNAFSYQDIAEALGIRKASIHHHYASKEELGTALVERFIRRFRRWSERLNEECPNDSYLRLLAYLKMLASIMHSDGHKICPQGIMSAEFNVLPPAMRIGLETLLGEQRQWLTELVDAGRREGVFVAIGSPAEQAILIQASMQGALQIARATGKPEHFYIICEQLQNLLVCEAHRSRLQSAAG